jgi:hypothetical protein
MLSLVKKTPTSYLIVVFGLSFYFFTQLSFSTMSLSDDESELIRDSEYDLSDYLYYRSFSEKWGIGSAYYWRLKKAGDAKAADDWRKRVIELTSTFSSAQEEANRIEAMSKAELKAFGVSAHMEKRFIADYNAIQMKISDARRRQSAFERLKDSAVWCLLSLFSFCVLVYLMRRVFRAYCFKNGFIMRRS